MIGFGKDFEKQCGEYLEYLYHLAEKRYNDCPDIDALVQDTLTALIVMPPYTSFGMMRTSI